MKKAQLLSLTSTLIFVVTLLLTSQLFMRCSDKEPMTDHPQLKDEGFISVAVAHDIFKKTPDDSYIKEQYKRVMLLKNEMDVARKTISYTTLEGAIEGLIEGKYDIIAHPITITSENKKRIAFSQPVDTSRYVLVQRNAIYNNNIQPIRDLTELAGKNVHICFDKALFNRLQNLEIEIADTFSISIDSIADECELIKKVAQGKVNFAVCSEKITQDLMRQHPQIDPLTPIGFKHERAWAVRKSSPILLDSVNNWLHKINTLERKGF